MKNIFIRNIKFWLVQSQKVMLVMLGFGIAYSLFFNLFLGQDMSYMFLIAIIFPMIVPITYISSFVPVTISFGSKRQEAVCGFQIMNIVTFVELLLADVIHNELFGEMLKLRQQSYIFLFICMLWTMSIGQIVGCISLKYGSKTIVVFSIIFASACIGGGAITGLILSREVDVFSAISLDMAKTVAIIVGIILYLVSILYFSIVIKKYEVRYV